MSTFLAIMGYAILIGAGIAALAALGVFLGVFLKRSTIEDTHH